MKKVVVVDIGTHCAQEFWAAFIAGSAWAGVMALRHTAGFILGRRRIPITWAGFRAYTAHRELLKKNRSNFFCVLVEPNQRLFRLPVYQKAEAAFNVALSNDAETVSVEPLYLVGGNLTGQGSSLYIGKPNVDATKSLTVLNVDVEHFAHKLKLYIDQTFALLPGDSSYAVALRINNEGAESDAIRAFEKVFSSAFKLVLGSLKDVGVAHGEGALRDLETFMSAKEIAFVPFHSNIATWEGATGALLTLAGIRH